MGRFLVILAVFSLELGTFCVANVDIELDVDVPTAVKKSVEINTESRAKDFVEALRR